MSSPTVVEFEVEESTIHETGDTTPPYVGIFSLMWPSAGVERASTQMIFPVREGQAIDWTPDADESPADSLSERWLFKQPIEGRFIFGATIQPFSVAQREERSEPGKTVEDTLTGLMKQAALAQSSLPGMLVSNLLSLAGDAFDRILYGPTAPIAHGEKLITDVNTQSFDLELLAPRTLGQVQKSEREEREEDKKEGTLMPSPGSAKGEKPADFADESNDFDLAKDDPNGSVTVSMKVR